MQKKQIHQDVYIGIICLLITGWALWLNRNLSKDAAMMPRLLCALLAILAVAITVKGVLETKKAAAREGEVKKYITLDTLKMPMITWLMVGGYALLFYLLGYFVATAVALIVMMRFLKRKNWKAILLIIAVYLVIMYAAFVIGMHVPVNNFGVIGNMIGLG